MILRRLLLNDPEALIAWAQKAEKPEVAALAREVCLAAEQGCRLSRSLIRASSQELIVDALTCANRVCAKTDAVEFILAGGLIARPSRLATELTRGLKRRGSKVIVRTLDRDTVWGAIEMARQANDFGAKIKTSTVQSIRKAVRKSWDIVPTAKGLSPTELRHPKSMNLDELTVEKAVQLMLDEEPRVIRAIRGSRLEIWKVIHMVEKAFRRGGRLFYVGAGTSGRLGVLDASECPPTFRSPPEWVQGIMAGGVSALFSAIEGAEDNIEAGEQAVRFHGVRRGDVVVGIAASGRTPFVWGALKIARAVGAKTVLLCCHPRLRFAPKMTPDVVIALATGPELLTGSTRLKAGTATKLVLNMITTVTMVRMGKVVSNLMVDLNPSNEKLRDRAVRMVQQLTSVSAERARTELQRSEWVVKKALKTLRPPTSRPSIRRR